MTDHVLRLTSFYQADGPCRFVLRFPGQPEREEAFPNAEEADLAFRAARSEHLAMHRPPAASPKEAL